MRGELLVVGEGENPPRDWDASVLLADQARSQRNATPWRAEAIRLLRDEWPGPGRLVVFTGSPPLTDYRGDTAHAYADVVIRRTSGNGPTPGEAWTAGHDSGRIVIDLLPSGDASSYETTAGAVTAALAHLGAGARRTGAERQVPLAIWGTGGFQRWYAAQRATGNTMLAARPVWSFRVGAERRLLFYWALHVAVHVAAEDRVKSNEVVISRPDIAVVVLYAQGARAALDDVAIVLVREYRAAASSPGAYVHELPGGSGTRPDDPRSLAIRELHEETGLLLDPGRLRAHGSRQLVASMSCHHAHLYSAEITAAELDLIRSLAGTSYGIEADTERTWPEVTTFRRIRTEGLVDWATLGLVAQALTDRFAARAEVTRTAPDDEGSCRG
ncbi:NUDIX domain-containing protein [Microbispora bryophytorum]|uniref:NUDIX domain-containing protein n=1 Tax=Microbispora bryophytorum TaxID=1460882 RepID=UPI0033E4D4D8